MVVRFEFLKMCCCISLMIITQLAYSQTSNWKMADSTAYNHEDSNAVWRSGSVAISHAFRSAYNNQLLVTGKYLGPSTKAAYFSQNEPRIDLASFPLDSTTVGIATSPYDSFQGVVVNNYGNFKSGVTFTDVHNSALEVNYNRGYPDSLGFRDGGLLQRAFVSKFSGSFANNGRPYRTQNFDIINLRLFTDNDVGNLAVVDNFYAIRMENFRGNNAGIIQNGWGIYMQPSQLKNYFGGNVGIGTTNVTHALTVNSTANPLKLTGVQTSATDTQLLSIDASGIVHSVEARKRSFVVTTSSTTLSDAYEVYVHKGGDVVYTLPAASDREGKTWRIVNIGTGTITLSIPFYEGKDLRTQILNVPTAHSYEIFSTGTEYVSF